MRSLRFAVFVAALTAAAALTAHAWIEVFLPVSPRVVVQRPALPGRIVGVEVSRADHDRWAIPAPVQARRRHVVVPVATRAPKVVLVAARSPRAFHVPTVSTRRHVTQPTTRTPHPAKQPAPKPKPKPKPTPKPAPRKVTTPAPSYTARTSTYSAPTYTPPRSTTHRLKRHVVRKHKKVRKPAPVTTSIPALTTPTPAVIVPVAVGARRALSHTRGDAAVTSILFIGGVSFAAVLFLLAAALPGTPARFTPVGRVVIDHQQDLVLVGLAAFVITIFVYLLTGHGL